jgi:hypothetical protein
MRSSRNRRKRRHPYWGGRQHAAPAGTSAGGEELPVRRAPGLRISPRHLETIFWAAYLLLPALTGWLDYQPLPNERYEPQHHELLSFHVREGWPNGLGSYKVPETWRDLKSGEVYSAPLFEAHHQSEARRLATNCFLYGLAGCAFFAYGRHARKKDTLAKAFGRAFVVDCAVSTFAYFLA